MQGHIATYPGGQPAVQTSSEDNNSSEYYESFSSTSLGNLSPYQLSQEELEFIARTEISSWHDLRRPLTYRPFGGDTMMEPPRLHRRRPDGALDFPRNGPSSRYSQESSWTAGRRTMSWSGSSAASMTSLSSTGSQNQAIVGQHYGHGKRHLDAGPKRPSVSLKAEMPMPAQYFSYGGQGDGSGLRSTRSISPRRTNPRYPAQKPVGKALTNKPGDGFRAISAEIWLLIISQLKGLHLGGPEETQTCATCFLRDLCSLARTNKKVGSPAQQRLYVHIMLSGQDSTPHIKKRFKPMKYGTRLKLLKRTLRDNSSLARLVRTLRVPTFLEARAEGDEDRRAYEDIVSSVIMACPNLEGVEGMLTKYDYGFARITQALSTRTELAEHMWLLDGTANELLTYAHARRARRGKLSEEDTAFLSLHTRWQKLNALAIHSSPSPSTLSSYLLDPLFLSLPSLQHLALLNVILPPDFPLFLPPLTSLNLSMQSLTPQNLSELTRSPITATLESLSLNLPPSILSLPTFARILASMKSLKRLSLTSPTPLELPLGISIFLHPYLASNSLRYLHWDVAPSTIIKESTDASHILAKAIAADGFPSLRRLRAVQDTGGVLQSVCIPSTGWEGVLLRGVLGVGPNGLKAKRKSGQREKDKKTNSVSRKSADSNASGSSRNSLRNVANGPMSAVYGDTTKEDLRERLGEARATAQARIEIAKLRPRWTLVAEDWTFQDVPKITAKSEVGGFVGMVGSKVEYYLDYHDDEGGIEELLHEDEEGGQICDGSWNVKDRSAWGGKRENGHKKRARGYKERSLSGLFC